MVRPDIDMLCLSVYFFKVFYRDYNKLMIILPNSDLAWQVLDLNESRSILQKYTQKIKAGKIGQHLRAHISLTKDTNSITSTYIRHFTITCS